MAWTWESTASVGFAANTASSACRRSDSARPRNPVIVTPWRPIFSGSASRARSPARYGLPTSPTWTPASVALCGGGQGSLHEGAGGLGSDAQLGASLVLDALEMACRRKQPVGGLIHHSDRGSQYACGDYQHRLCLYGMRASMSRNGNCYDNAPMESFFATFKAELVYQQHSPRGMKPGGRSSSTSKCSTTASEGTRRSGTWLPRNSRGATMQLNWRLDSRDLRFLSGHSPFSAGPGKWPLRLWLR